MTSVFVPSRRQSRDLSTSLALQRRLLGRSILLFHDSHTVLNVEIDLFVNKNVDVIAQNANTTLLLFMEVAIAQIQVSIVSQNAQRDMHEFPIQ